MKKTLLIAAAVTLIAAGPASASGFTLTLAAPPAVVGTPLVMQATGTIPVGDLAYPYWFSLDAVPTAVATTCPPDRWEGEQFGRAAGSVIVLSQRETPDPSGRFTIPVVLTPTAAGSVLLCGYTDDGMTNTLAQAALVLDIAPAAAPPAQLARELRGCHGHRRCVRAAVRRARAGCRRYPSHRRQARCLRSVRKVARRAA